MRRLVRIVAILAGLALVLVVWRGIRIALRPNPTAPDSTALAHASNTTIYRDSYGVPHIFGKCDADAAFGLAFAHAEDDFPIIQFVIAATRGRLGLLVLSQQALVNDFYAQFIGVHDDVEAHYGELDEHTRGVLEAYAAGLNFYAYHHADDVDTRLLPFTGRDIAGGLAHKLPILIGMTEQLKAIAGDQPRAVGDALAMAEPSTGSNAHAVSSARSTDGVVRLNVNSHQPWEGPVTWYEAQVVSEEGWNMTGGTFPGAPMILHGHNEHLGWAHTVNTPDLVDVYKLAMNADHPLQYRYDGAWLELEKEIDLLIDTGWFVLPIGRNVYRSVHGPVFETKHGFYAFRYAGKDRMLLAAEQWFKMNKASNFAEWKAAMSMMTIPMFNTVYADDANNIYYLYNARLPVRRDGHDYTKILPGDDSSVVFTEYRRFEELPAVENPASGFVQSCNATPFAATDGPENPRPEKYSPNDGIETHQTNRALRSLEILAGDRLFSHDDFLTMKWDRKYSRKSEIYTELIDPLLKTHQSQDEHEQRGLELLRGWDGMTAETSTAAALAILAFRPVSRSAQGMLGPEGVLHDPHVAFSRAVRFLIQHYGRLDVPLGEIQRLRRGTVDLPLGGGPDILNAAYTHDAGDKLIGYQGDSYVLIVEFQKSGVTSASVHQYGNVNRPSSPHYADQAPLFLARKLKRTIRARDELEREAVRKYHPGS